MTASRGLMASWIEPLRLTATLPRATTPSRKSVALRTTIRRAHPRKGLDLDNQGLSRVQGAAAVVCLTHAHADETLRTDLDQSP